MSGGASILREQWRVSCDRLAGRLEGLTDEELLWEPCTGCWSVRPTGEAWVMDYVVPDPRPAPVTTIAWRLHHIAHGNWIYWEHSFGPAERTFADLSNFGSATEVIADLRASQEPVTKTLALLDDDALDRERPTHFGTRWPVQRIFMTLLNEQVHHGAEVGVLRDLYAQRASVA